MNVNNNSNKNKKIRKSNSIYNSLQPTANCYIQLDADFRLEFKELAIPSFLIVVKKKKDIFNCLAKKIWLGQNLQHVGHWSLQPKLCIKILFLIVILATRCHLIRSQVVRLL